MKMVFASMILLLLPLLTYATESCDQPSYPDKTRVYFVNGMFTDEKNAHNDKKELQKLLHGYNSGYSFGLSINHDEAQETQLLEVFIQRRTDTSTFWGWMARLDLAPQWFKDAYNNAHNYFNEYNYANDPDLQMMIFEYLEDLNSGKKVILVPHSQGN